MIYPQGKIIHQNLSAEYTDVPQLLNTLSATGFSGVIEIETEDAKGAFFIISGRIVNAAIGLESNPPAMVGESAVNELYLLAKQSKGLLHVSELSAVQIAILTGPFASELVFKGLSTDFILMDQFIAKLNTEKHTGYIEIFSKSGDKIGTLLFKEGEATSFQMVSGPGNMNHYEGDSIPSALDYAVRNGAVFDVYRNTDTLSAVPEVPDSIRREADASAADLPVVPEPEPEPEPETESIAGPAMEAGPEGLLEEIELSFKDRLADELANIQEPAPIQKRAAPAACEDEISISHREGLIADLERVLSKLESFTDHVGSKGDFQRLFRYNCVERSEEHHFLDPFEGQFEYDSGKIDLSDDVGSDDFAIASANCLNAVLKNLNTDFLKGAAMPPGLKGEIETAFRNYKDLIRDSGLDSIVPANTR